MLHHEAELAIGFNKAKYFEVVRPRVMEAKMHQRYPRDRTINSCVICQRKFGLIRYYSWRTALCSKRCKDRLLAREERDRKWFCVQIG
jgi:hypothetical protein